MKEQELLDAARRIKHHCAERVRGDGCCFGVGGVCVGARNCHLNTWGASPGVWDIDPRIWPETDIDMAQALTLEGFSHIRCLVSGEWCTAIKINGESKVVPYGMFSQLETGEVVYLSDIMHHPEVGKDE